MNNCMNEWCHKDMKIPNNFSIDISKETINDRVGDSEHLEELTIQKYVSLHKEAETSDLVCIYEIICKEALRSWVNKYDSCTLGKGGRSSCKNNP